MKLTHAENHISVATHLSISELEQRYRSAKDGVESRQYQIIWLLAQGKKTDAVEKITGYSRTWMYTLVKRYNELGIEGLGDRRQFNKGSQALVDDIHQAQLCRFYKETPQTEDCGMVVKSPIGSLT